MSNSDHSPHVGSLTGEIQVVRSLRKASSVVQAELVSINNVLYVLKTDTVCQIEGQKFFNNQLGLYNLPRLQLYKHPALKPNQILMEYITDSPTIGSSLSVERCKQWGAVVAGMHAITHDLFSIMDDTGMKINMPWVDWLKKTIDYAVTYNLAEEDGLLPLMAKLLAELVAS